MSASSQQRFVGITTGTAPAIARMYSVTVSGVPNALLLIFLAVELLGSAVTLREYRRFPVSS